MNPRSALVAAFAAASCVLAGCAVSTTSGSGSVSSIGSANPSSSATGRSGSTSTSPTNIPSSRPELKDKMLSLSDLPAGWKLQYNKPGGGSVFGTDVANGHQAAAERSASFVYGNSVPILAEDVMYYPQDADAIFHAATHLLDGRRRLPIDKHTSLKFGRIPFARLRDGAAAYQGRGQVSGHVFAIDLVVFRSSDYLTVVVYGGLGVPSKQDVRGKVAKAAAKLPA